jgi:D-aspartate ligase
LPSHAPGVLLLGSDFKALGVARSLGRHGVDVAVIDSLPRSAWFSRHVSRRFRWPGPLDGELFVDHLIDMAGSQHMHGAVLWPAQDDAMETVARNWQRLGGVYRMVTQPWEIISRAHDKKLLHSAADEVGVPHPKTWYPRDEDELRGLPVQFPAVIKPAVSIDLQHAIGRKALPASQMPALLRVYREAAQIVPPGGLMVQEVISGDGQYSVGAFASAGAIRSAMTARRTRQYPIDYGLSSTFVEAIEVPGLLEPAHKLIEHLGLSGMVEVEFIRDRRDGEFKLLDINPRPWGWHALCMACGLDFPAMTYAQALGGEVASLEPRYGPRWIRLLTDIPAGIQSIRAGMLTPGGYARSLFSGTTIGSVFDLDDPWPAAGDLVVACLRCSGVLRRRPQAVSDSPLMSTPPTSPPKASSAG